jgi:hypothetical protein
VGCRARQILDNSGEEPAKLGAVPSRSRQRLTYGAFLKAIRDQAGFRLKVASAFAYFAALWSENGAPDALLVEGFTLLGGATLGYGFWRWWMRRR